MLVRHHPAYYDTTTTVRSHFRPSGLQDWYDPVLLSVSTLGEYAASTKTVEKVTQILLQLQPDDYVRYLLSYYRTGLDRFGEAWKYADITTALLAVGEIVKPDKYLEVGVRRGRSMAMLAACCPECHLVGFDYWLPDYAGMANPGPDHVKAELVQVGHRGRVELISGNSHSTLPAYFTAHPEASFDVITVDGDHSVRGARRDLHDVLPHLKVGGVILFDDTCNPFTPGLGRVWERVVCSDDRFSTWSYRDLGYGVGIAVRKR
jgi:hypothetical protein